MLLLGEKKSEREVIFIYYEILECRQIRISSCKVSCYYKYNNITLYCTKLYHIAAHHPADTRTESNCIDLLSAWKSLSRSGSYPET